MSQFEQTARDIEVHNESLLESARASEAESLQPTSNADGRSKTLLVIASEPDALKAYADTPAVAADIMSVESNAAPAIIKRRVRSVCDCHPLNIRIPCDIVFLFLTSSPNPVLHLLFRV
jgi:hypothetical protein